MSVRMLSRPSSSSGSAQQIAGGGSSGAAVPTSPPDYLPKSPSILVSPSRSPGSGAAASPSATRLSPSPVSDILGTDSILRQFPAIDVEYPGAAAPKIVLPPPYEEEDFTDPLTKHVVVIGVISRLEDEASQLLDRILLSQVFSGSKCANPRNLQGDQETVLTANPNLTSDDVVPILTPPTVRVLPQENGFVRGKSHGKGRGKYDESRDGSRRDQNSGPRAGDTRSQTPQKTKGSIEKKVARNGRERDWIDGKIKNHYDREKGVLYVQYVWGSSPRECLTGENRTGESLAEALERHEADSLRGLLFMFSVCHILLIVQEGSRFDPRYLRMFRTLQTAKHALAPFVKSQVLPNVLPQTAGRSSPSPRAGVASRDMVGSRGLGISAGRQSSSNGYTGGPAPVLYPGQCTPVALFVCLEECTESASGFNFLGSTAEDAAEGPGVPSSVQSGPGSSASPGSTYTRQSRSSLPNPGSSRPGNKTEGGVRKKLQASTEAQIRFLLKKCRTLASVVGEGGSSGSAAAALRGLTGGVNTFGGAGNGGALFALDQSRAAVFIDRASNRQGAGLEEISDVIANFLRNMGGPSTQTLNLAGLSEPVLDDIQAIKDFLLRHTEILRGRGAIANTATGSSGGAGMVAAAAAAAAASASGGAGGATKPLHNPPDLPTVSAWFSASQILADALASAWENRDTTKTETETSEKIDNLKNQESSPRKSMRRYSQSSQGATHANSTGGTSNSSTVARQRVASLDGVISSLESAIDLDHKFSKTWCKRILPTALEVYLEDLPSTYPTSVHNAHLQKALVVFQSMVRGPAVSSYVGKLTASCESIWHAGRQLCDAVSLTGKPCRHLVHDVAIEYSDSSLDACDPGVLTQTKLQKRHTKGGGVCKPHSSGVMFLHACACGRSRKLRKDPFDYGSANVTFYRFPNCEDSLPSMFMPPSSSDNYMGGLSWSLVRLGSARYYQPGSGLMQIGFIPEQKYLSLWDMVVLYENNLTAGAPPANADAILESQKAEIEPDHANYTFSGSQNGSIDSKQGLQVEQSFYSKVAEKGSVGENSRVTGRTSTPRMDKSTVSMSSSSNVNYGGDSAFPPLPQKTKTTPLKTSRPSSVTDRPNGAEEIHSGGKNDSLKNIVVGHGMASLKIDADKEDKEPAHDAPFADGGNTSSVQRFNVYVGFEHECPHGHRFFLSANHVQSLGLSYPQSNPSHVVSELDTVSRLDSRISVMNEPVTSNGIVIDKKSREGSDVMRIVKGSGEGHLLLEMDLPIYMHCPHCEASAGREEKRGDMVYAGCVSQLQRIFLVTPPTPLMILTTQAVVQFEDLSSGTPKQQGHLQQGVKQEGINVSGATEIVLPPDSFLVLRLPFVYHSFEKNGNLRPLSYQKDAPERSAWLVKGTALRLHAKLGAHMMNMQQDNQDFVEQMEADLVRNAHSYIGEAPLSVKDELLGLARVNSMMICSHTGKTSKGLETVEGDSRRGLESRELILGRSELIS